jgi:hypothetical protein
MSVPSKKKVVLPEAETEKGRYKDDALVFYQGNIEASVIFSNDDGSVALKFRDGSPARWNVPASQVSPREVAKGSHRREAWPMPTPWGPKIKGKSREFEK